MGADRAHPRNSILPPQSGAGVFPIAPSQRKPAAEEIKCLGLAYNGRVDTIKLASR
jgi:hypothetical protein